MANCNVLEEYPRRSIPRLLKEIVIKTCYNQVHLLSLADLRQLASRPRISKTPFLWLFTGNSEWKRMPNEKTVTLPVGFDEGKWRWSRGSKFVTELQESLIVRNIESWETSNDCSKRKIKKREWRLKNNGVNFVKSIGESENSQKESIAVSFD